MSTAAFFIQTPFEMICAINALHHYNISNYKFYIIKDDQGRLPQLIGIADQYGIEYEVVPFEFILRGGLKRAVTESLLFTNGNYDMVFTGDFRAALTDIYIMPFIRKRGKLVKLDDGNCTIDMLNNNISVLSSDIKRNRWWLSLLCSVKKIEVIYYTVFDKIPNDKYQLEINDMKYLQSQMGDNASSDEIMFIGTVPDSYIQDIHISINDYYSFLRNVFSLLKDKGKPVKYILHGRDKNLKTIEMCEEFGFEYFKPQESIESYIIRNGYCPQYISGLTSTALFSLKKLLPKSEFTNIVPKLDPTVAQSLYAISDYYVANGIELLKLDVSDS